MRQTAAVFNDKSLILFDENKGMMPSATFAGPHCALKIEKLGGKCIDEYQKTITMPLEIPAGLTGEYQKKSDYSLTLCNR